jgi:hypothetical protein
MVVLFQIAFLITDKITTGEDIQGFITSKDRFVDRKEAYKIAVQSGQVHSNSLQPELKELYSEDLY